MENKNSTIKITNGTEVRKLKNITSFHQLVDTIWNKMKIEAVDENYELVYKDEDGEKINLSTSEDFEEYLRFEGKLPKIELKKLYSDLDNDPLYKNIQMTVSTIERPIPRGDNAYEGSKLEDPDDFLFEEVDHKITEDSSVQASVDFLDKDWETEQPANKEEIKIESDSKATSTVINEAFTSSVQTQSVENTNVATDVNNLLHNHDQYWNTEVPEQVDQANQQDIKLVDLALDPVQSSVNDQAVGDDLVQIEEEHKQLQKSDQNDHNKDSRVTEERLREIIVEQINLMRSTILEECQNFISQKASKKDKENLLEMSVHHFKCFFWGVYPIVGVRYQCIQDENINMCSNCEKVWDYKYPVLKIRKEEMVDNYLSVMKESNIGDQSISTSIFKSLMSRDNLQDVSSEEIDDKELLEELKEEMIDDPVIQEEIEEKKQEYPELVKRSWLVKYERFSDSYLASLKVALVYGGPINVNKNSETNDIEVKLYNPDNVGNTRWPINSTIMCIHPDPSYLMSSSNTIKEVRPGVNETFRITLSSAKKVGKEKIILTLIDEYGRTFGDPFDIIINTVDADIVYSHEEPSVFDIPVPIQKPKEVHPAKLKYKKEIEEIKSMGFNVDEKVLDLLVEFNGDLAQVVDQIM